MISEVWYVLSKSISWHESVMCLQSWHQIPRKIFRLLRLRFRLSFFPGSHHLPWQLNHTTCSWNHSQHQVPYFKQQNSRHDKYRNQANQEQLQPLFIMSPSDLLATPSSECLQERCSRHRHWETYDNKTNLKQLTKQHANPSCVTRRTPPFKLTLDLCTQPYRLIENNEWTSSWQK